MADWRSSFVAMGLIPGMEPLDLTDEKPGQGVPGLALHLTGQPFPTCSIHGSMNRVSATQSVYRCLACNTGCEWKRP